MEITIKITTFENLYQLFSVGFGIYTDKPHDISNGMIFLNTIAENGQQDSFLNLLKQQEQTVQSLYQILTSKDSFKNYAEQLDLELPKCLCTPIK